MIINPIIYKEMKLNNNIITTKRAIELGFSKALLPKYEREGLIELIRQGIYILPESVHDDMYTLMLRSENIIFPHETALFLLELTDRTPFEHSVTIPSDTSLPESVSGECKCYYIQPQFHRLGMIYAKTNAAWTDKNINRLSEYALTFHIEKKLKSYLEILL